MEQINGKDLMTHLEALEKDIRYREPAQPGEDEFRYIPGNRPVLVSAPHGAAHIRNGRLKEEDEYTGAIARYLGSVTGCHALYLRRQALNDSNYDKDTSYKQFLKSTIKQAGIRFVLDLHGASDHHAFGMALGTMNGRSCPEQFPMILSVLNEHGFMEDKYGSNGLDIDKSFTASGGQRQETITRFVNETLGIPAVQIELASHVRVVQVTLENAQMKVYRGDPLMIEKTVTALIELVRRV